LAIRIDVESFIRYATVPNDEFSIADATAQDR
jgi:hypothetical protein